MQVKFSMDKDFETLYDSQIPEVLKVQGIHADNLDIQNFRRQFFGTNETVSDLSVDGNANVKAKTIVHYQDEVYKAQSKLQSYETLYRLLKQNYGKETADLCVGRLFNGELFINDMTGFDMPYCYAFDLTPILETGYKSKTLNFTMKPAKRVRSLIAQFIQLVATMSTNVIGAVAFPNLFLVMDYLYRKELGEDYLEKEEFSYDINNDFQNLIFSLNWNFRRTQTAFTNLSVLDDGFMERIFGEYIYPDNTKVNIKSVKKLSQRYFEYFTEVFGKEGIFTFPVNTLAISKNDDGTYIDPDFVDWVAKWNHKKSTANVLLSSPTCFSSCCRLKNNLELNDNGLQNSFGVGSVSVGSHRVCGLNLPRISVLEDYLHDTTHERLREDLDCIHKILLTHRRHIQSLIDKHLLPLYDEGLMFLNKQYSTIGFVGAYEYAYNKGLDICNEEGLECNKHVFDIINAHILKWQEQDVEFQAIYNLEQIPAESMASRLAEMDEILGYNPHHFELYSNQYVPLVKDVSIGERIKLQGFFDQYTSGGSVLHITNYDNEPIPEHLYRNLIDYANKCGATYFALNYAYSTCENGHTILGTKHDKCPVCEGEITDVFTRVVGFITNVKTWTKARRKEFKERKSVNLTTV